MNEKMKILVAYDGSDCADAALADLQRAGLPPALEVTVLSVAESWLPPPSGYEILESALTERSPGGLAEARALSRREADLLEEFIPSWKVHAEASHGSPAAEIVNQAERMGADLIVVGSHGLSALGRLFLGSVSQKVATDAGCSVRVARKRSNASNLPPRILIGIDGSPYSAVAARMVAARQWPAHSEARLVTAVGPLPDLPLSIVREHLKYARHLQQEASEELQAAGLAVSTAVEVADPKKLLLSQAEEWGAECIFVGTRGHNRLERLLLGSVATAIVARAHCSVEVVRAKD